MKALRATTFQDSNRSFLMTLDEHDIEYSRIIKLSGASIASGITIEILITGGWGALAVACLAWAHVRKSRRINVTTKDNQSIWLEGYSAEDAARILQSAKTIAVIDAKSDDGKA